MTTRSNATRLVCALLALSAVAFAAGVALERSRPGESVAEVHATAAEQGKSAATESSSSAEPSGSEQTGSESTGSDSTVAESTGVEGGVETTVPVVAGAPVEAVGHSEAGESLLGIKTESTSLVVVAILLSFALALLIWLRSSVLLLAAAVAVGLVFAAFDVREALHQSDRSDSTLVVVALVVALLHVGVIVAAAGSLRERRATVAR